MFHVKKSDVHEIKATMQALANTKTSPFPVYLEMKTLIQSEQLFESKETHRCANISELSFQFGQTVFPTHSRKECPYVENEIQQNSNQCHVNKFE
jgi:hypothetical protein